MDAPKLTQNQMINHILRRNDTAKSVRRQRWESLWDEVMQYLWPQMGSMIAGKAFQPGEKRGQRCYDGTPESALDVMVAGLQAGTIPENYPWFDWELVPKWANTQRVRLWLQKCRDITLEFLAASNFGMATNLTYRHVAAFGTACKFRVKSTEPGKAFSFNTLRLTDCVFFENHQGIVDALFWEFKLSARNAVKRWGDDAPGACKRAVESGNHDSEFPFLQAIFPREEYNSELKDSKNMPWASWIINTAKRSLVEESGFKIFPASVPRWDKLDDQAFAYGAQLGGGVYGRGPGVKLVQDMNTLNKMRKTNLIAGEKMANSPIMVPSDGYDRTIHRHPGGVNFYDQQASHGAKIETIDDVKGLPFSIELHQDQRQMVQKGFYVDLFQTFAMLPPGMTATEATIRNQEKLVILEPSLTRQKVEHLERDLDWAFAVLDEMGYFPPPPDEVYQFGTGIKNIFKSPLFMAAESVQAGKVLTYYQKLGAIVQARGGKSEVMDNVNDDRAAKVLAIADGVPVEIESTPEEIKALRQQRQQQMKAMIQEQTMATMAKAAGQVGKIKTGEGEENVVSDAIQAATGEAK